MRFVYRDPGPRDNTHTRSLPADLHLYLTSTRHIEVWREAHLVAERVRFVSHQGPLATLRI